LSFGFRFISALSPRCEISNNADTGPLAELETGLESAETLVKHLETHYEEIAEQVGVNVLWPSAHVLLLKMTNALADGGLDFSLGFHRAGIGRAACLR